MDGESTAVPGDRSHVFRSWSAQGSGHLPPVAGGQGSWFWDHHGNRYLDMASQLINVNLGHQHPRLLSAIKDQADELCTVAPHFGNETRERLARLIAERAPGDLTRVFFTNGGTDANEHAIRMAKLATDRPKLLSAYRSYHGATSGSITLTGDPRRWPNEPGLPGVTHFFGPYAYRSAFHARDERQECERALRHLDEVFQMEGPHTVAAVVLETIVGTNGVLVPPDGYLEGVRALCDRYGALLICDEVMVGFGRIGEWFAVDAWQVTPDLITFAKGVNSGYVPLGGVVVGERVMSAFEDRVYPGGLTYSGHPLACAPGIATIDVFEDTGVLEHVRRLGREVMAPELEKLADRHPSVGEVRGRGLFWAIELVRDRQSREPLVPFNASGAAAEPMEEVMAACVGAGVWPMCQSNRIHIAPPLVVTEEELRWGLDAIGTALATADTYATA
ncbi:aspartate aminotransferase family protein [Streptomyces sp. RPA4-5]|uniref:aspartate aminotransferase family protein n=1 Tax=Streptomyces sp. RPA4-5 TaxID=2721245 RepID=UPI00143EF441|nr:aspartate aminotransferase family protein [Streptomyces sp. RPA4-5]QIY54441.1 aspartate aminotransferase family protein [Streptomyces sp. RPA4-5]